jgi:dolichol-phosphate mannosyltransferase
MTDATESHARRATAPPRQGNWLLQYAGSTSVSTAITALADAGVFLGLTAAGLRFGPAHITSFIVATALNYYLNIRTAAANAGRARDLRLHAHLIVIGLAALFLRGGVLALLTNSWAWPPSLAILFAIGTALAITLPGYAFCLSTPSPWRMGTGPRWSVLALGLVIYAFVLRVVYLGQVELLPEETYYWNYSRHLDIGYLDHPPMVAWLIWLATSVLGTSQFSVRVVALFCAAATAFFTYRLTRNLFDASSALAAMVLSQVLPFFFLAGMLMTPDTPLVAAWAAELYFLERALVCSRASAWWGVGIGMGLGMLSKYSIGLLVPAAFLFMLLDPQSRRWLRHWRPYAAALIALTIFSPVIAWNAQNGWASFAFQSSRRLTGEPQFALHKLLLAALVLITPTGFFAAANSLFGRLQETEDSNDTQCARRKWRFMRVVVLTPLAVFAVVSIRHNVKFDWTGELWLGAVPGIAFAMTSSDSDLNKLAHSLRSMIERAWAPTILGAVLIYAAGLHFLVLGLPGFGYAEQMQLMPVGWRDLGQQVHRIAKDAEKATGAQTLIVGMDRYAIASEVAFYSPDAANGSETSGAHLFGWTGLMYTRWVPIDLQNGRTLLLVTWKPEDLTDSCVESRAERLGPLKVGVLRRDSAVIRLYYYRFAYGYRSSPPCVTY